MRPDEVFKGQKACIMCLHEWRAHGRPPDQCTQQLEQASSSAFAPRGVSCSGAGIPGADAASAHNPPQHLTMRPSSRRKLTSVKAQEMQEVQEANTWLDGTESGMDSAGGAQKDTADYTADPEDSSDDYEVDEQLVHNGGAKPVAQFPVNTATAAAPPNTKKSNLPRKSTRGQHKKVPGGLSEADTKAAYLEQLRECLAAHDCEMNPADWTVELHSRKDRRGGWDPCFAYKGHKVGRAAAAAMTYACKLGPNATQKKQSRVHLQDWDLDAIKAAYTERLLSTLVAHGIPELPPGYFDIRLHKRNDRNSYRASYCYRGKVFRNPSHAVTAYLSELQEHQAQNMSTATHAHQVHPTLANCLSSTAYGSSDQPPASPPTGSKRRRTSPAQAATGTSAQAQPHPLLMQPPQRPGGQVQLQADQGKLGLPAQQLMWMTSASKDLTAVSNCHSHVLPAAGMAAPVGHSPVPVCHVGQGTAGVLRSPFQAAGVIRPVMAQSQGLPVSTFPVPPPQVMAISCYGLATSKMSRGVATAVPQPVLSFAGGEGPSQQGTVLHVNTQRVACVDDPSTPNQPPRSANDLGPTECGTAEAIEGLFKLRHGSWEGDQAQAARFAFHQTPRASSPAVAQQQAVDQVQEVCASGKSGSRDNVPESCAWAPGNEATVMKTAMRPFQPVPRMVCAQNTSGDASVEVTTLHI